VGLFTSVGFFAGTGSRGRTAPAGSPPPVGSAPTAAVPFPAACFAERLRFVSRLRPAARGRFPPRAPASASPRPARSCCTRRCGFAGRSNRGCSAPSAPAIGTGAAGGSRGAPLRNRGHAATTSASATSPLRRATLPHRTLCHSPSCPIDGASQAARALRPLLSCAAAVLRPAQRSWLHLNPFTT
jgi:hypothetical protein